MRRWTVLTQEMKTEDTEEAFGALVRSAVVPGEVVMVDEMEVSLASRRENAAERSHRTTAV